MILSQEEREYIQLFKDMIVVLYADSDIEPLLTFCNQCITKEAEIFSSMSRHLEMMRKKNNDIQNAQYLKNVINGVIAMLGNENIILYDNIEQLDVQFRKQIKITLAIFDSLDKEYISSHSLEEISQYICDNSFIKKLDIRLISSLKKLYAKNNTIDESDKDILIALIKYFLYDMQHKIKYNYINIITPFKHHFAKLSNKKEVIKENGNHVYERDVEFSEYYELYKNERKNYPIISKNIIFFETIFKSIFSYRVLTTYTLESKSDILSFLDAVRMRIPNNNHYNEERINHMNRHIDEIKANINNYHDVYCFFDRKGPKKNYRSSS